MRKNLLESFRVKVDTKEEAITCAIKAHNRARDYAVKTGLWALMTLISCRKVVDSAEYLAAWIKGAKYNDKIVKEWPDNSK